MLQEMSEEWDQCDHKLKESRDWTDKARANLDSPANRNKPIRDQGGRPRISIAEIPGLEFQTCSKQSKLLSQNASYCYEIRGPP